MPDAAGLVVEQVARQSYGRLMAFLSARTRDVAAAEDALSEAFVAALATWPRDGIPDKPEAWLLTTARRRLIERLRVTARSQDATPRSGGRRSAATQASCTRSSASFSSRTRARASPRVNRAWARSFSIAGGSASSFIRQEWSPPTGGRMHRNRIPHGGAAKG